MQSTRRRPFTESDDEHLAEYIAKNNPEVSGRQGNKLYETLVENPKRWPWSRSHPWSSWRERYKKNTELFDRRINRYLKARQTARKSTSGRKKVPNNVEASNRAGANSVRRERPQAAPEMNMTDGESIREDDYMHELFGSFTEEEDVAAPKEPPASSGPSSPATDRMYPDLQHVPSANIAEKEPHLQDSVEVTRPVRPPQDPTPLAAASSQLPASPLPPPSHLRPTGTLHGEERLLKRKVPDEDPFIDNTPPLPSPTLERQLGMRKAPPVLNEGPFGNRFVQTRNPADNENVTVWPPNRKRKETDGASQTTTAHASATGAVIGQKLQQTVASSSKVKLPASTALKPDDPLLMGTASQRPVPKGVAQSIPTAVGSHDRTMNIECSRRVDTEQPFIKRQKVGHPLVAQQESISASLSASTLLAHMSNNSQGTARVPGEKSSARHIDLRVSLRKKHSRFGKSPLLSSRSSTASISNFTANRANRRDSTASRHRYVTEDKDQELISLFERDLAGLGEQYGFALGVVKQTYLQFGTLEKTVVVLRTLNAYMMGAQDRVYDEMQRIFNGQDEDENTDDGELIPEGVIPKVSSSKGKEKKTGDGESHGTPSNKRQRQSLNYKPLTIDHEDQSAYSPPSRTRAGRYTKLQKEGREEEALIAASGGTRGARRREAQHQAIMIKRGMEPSPPSDLDPGRSPTPEFIGVHEADSEAEKHEEEEEEEEEEEDNDGDVGLIIEHDRMDVSPDQYQVRQPMPELEQIDDEEFGWKAEYRKLCSEVTFENQDTLRAFQERHDDALLKTQSWGLIKEGLAALQGAQEVRRREHQRSEAEQARQAEEWEEYGSAEY